MRPCGMCASVCWRCEERHALLKRSFEEQEARVVELEIAFAEADDGSRDVIGERLTGATEALCDIWQQLEDMDGEE